MSDWVEIPEFPDYDVGSSGKVRNAFTGRVLRATANQSGLVYVGLMDVDGVQRQRSLALLVARAFIPQPMEHWDTPINLDGNRWDCSVGNLVWRTRWYALHYHRQFLFAPVIDQAIRNIETHEMYANSREAAIRFGLLEAEISASIFQCTYASPGFHRFDMLDL